MINFRIKELVCSVGVCFSLISHASDELSQAHHGPHIHGLAEATIALEGKVLEIGLQSPASNIVGFEHKARTKEQIDKVQQAKNIT